jgi:hypothetical protein
MMSSSWKPVLLNFAIQDDGLLIEEKGPAEGKVIFV